MASLASQANLDYEQTLVELWSAGIEYVDSPSSRILTRDIRLAETAVGVAGSRQRQISFWLNAYGLSREELTELLKRLGHDLTPNMSRMPRGSIKRLNAHMASRDDYSARILEQRREEIKRADSLPKAPPFEWTAKGTTREALLLTVSEVQGIHEELEKDFAYGSDPISPPGVRSLDLLESAVSRPSTSLGGQYKYSTIQSAGAALLHSLVQNHAFHNGNKRTALVSLLVMLDRNNFVLESTEEEMFKWLIKVASHKLLPSGFEYDYRADRETFAITEWICRHSRMAVKEERSITWRELSKLLRSKNCTITQHRGEKLKIERDVTVKRIFLGSKTRTLTTYFTNTGDGREVPRSVLKSLRQELELDEEHGVDSEMFYSSRREPDFFILEYSKLLKRLARV